MAVDTFKPLIKQILSFDTKSFFVPVVLRHLSFKCDSEATQSLDMNLLRNGPLQRLKRQAEPGNIAMFLGRHSLRKRLRGLLEESLEMGVSRYTIFLIGCQ